MAPAPSKDQPPSKHAFTRRAFISHATAGNGYVADDVVIWGLLTDPLDKPIAEMEAT